MLRITQQQHLELHLLLAALYYGTYACVLTVSHEYFFMLICYSQAGEVILKLLHVCTIVLYICLSFVALHCIVTFSKTISSGK